MVVVPAGSYQQGSEGEDAPAQEQPRRTVTIGQAFAAGRYEVTLDNAENRIATCTFNSGSADGGAVADGAEGGGDSGHGSVSLGFRSEAYRDIVWARLRRKKVAYYEGVHMAKVGAERGTRDT